MSEIGIVSHSSLRDTSTDEDSRMDGRHFPMPNLEIRVVDDRNHIVGIGQDGHLEVKSHSALKEYKHEEQKTKALFTKDGFFRTGDIAVMYPDGSHRLKGRSVDAMRFNILGKVVYPGPIEEIMSMYSGVKNVIVSIAGTNDAYGDEVTYCIVLNEGVSQPFEENIMEYLIRKKVDAHQMPARILYFDQLPTTPNSRKFNKPAVKEEIKKRVEADPNAGVTSWYREMCKTLAEGFKG